MEGDNDSGVGSIDSPGEPASPTDYSRGPSSSRQNTSPSSTPPPLPPPRRTSLSYVSRYSNASETSGTRHWSIGSGAGEKRRRGKEMVDKRRKNSYLHYNHPPKTSYDATATPACQVVPTTTMNTFTGLSNSAMNANVNRLTARTYTPLPPGPPQPPPKHYRCESPHQISAMTIHDQGVHIVTAVPDTLTGIPLSPHNHHVAVATPAHQHHVVAMATSHHHHYHHRPHHHVSMVTSPYHQNHHVATTTSSPRRVTLVTECSRGREEKFQNCVSNHVNKSANHVNGMSAMSSYRSPVHSHVGYDGSDRVNSSSNHVQSASNASTLINRSSPNHVSGISNSVSQSPYQPSPDYMLGGSTVSHSVNRSPTHVPGGSNASSRVNASPGHVLNASSCVNVSPGHVIGVSNASRESPSHSIGPSNASSRASPNHVGFTNIYNSPIWSPPTSSASSVSSRSSSVSSRTSRSSGRTSGLSSRASSFSTFSSIPEESHTHSNDRSTIEEEAEDPDLDALLADLCQLEADTKAQLETSQQAQKKLLTPDTDEANRMHTPDILDRDLVGVSVSSSSLPPPPPPPPSGGDPPPPPPPPPPRADTNSSPDTSVNRGYANLMIRNEPSTGAVSSDEFAHIMESLQNSRNVVQDPSRAIAFSMYSSANETDGGVKQQAGGDIFSGNNKRESQRFGTNSGGTGTKQKGMRKSSLQRTSSRDGESSPAHEMVQKQLDAFADQLSVDEALTQDQQMQKLKNEKLRIAMMKLKEASVQKMVLKVHNVDGSTKMIAIHEQMNARDVCILLAERNHKPIGPNWTVVERLTDLHLERTLEDHEKVLESLAHWPKGSTNSVVFKNNPEKYYLLKRPQMLMPSSHVYSSVNVTRTAFTEEQKKNIILKEIFNNKILPKLEGDLHIREGKKSSWKKHLFVLRASGLYYSRSGKSLASKDIVRVVEWKDVECFLGSNYKKFYRAPGPHCYSLVPTGPLAQNEKKIIHLCVPNKQDLMAWVTGIRLAKHGIQLKQNYEDTKSEMPWLQLEDDNLDLVATPEKKATEVTSALTPTISPPQQNGMEPGKRQVTSSHSASHLSRPESTVSRAPLSFGSRESVMSVSTSSSHIISGPVSAGRGGGGGGGSTGRRARAQHNALANAFEGAWKQGNLTAEMNRESQMWPSFSTTPKHMASDHRHQSPHNTSGTHPSSSLSGGTADLSLPYEEEMSGMVTLKRKKDRGGPEGEQLSRSSSVSNHSQRSSSSSGGGHRRRSQSIDPGLANRTSRGSHNHHSNY